ncbi:MAG: flagella basal body P-ring formation protein FlgA [Halomonadaceae bacterium]|nr:MAG: flagella basal body P-ring formation protein FlgA [Halomonadaceae bacterium]
MRLNRLNFGIYSGLIACLLLPVQPLQAASTVERIYRAADAFMADYVRLQESRDRTVAYELGSLDSRLSMEPCPQPLKVSFSGDPERNARTTLLVSCEGDRPWRLFLNSRIEIQAQGWVTSQPIGRGVILEQSMLEARQVTINEQRQGGYQNPELMLGMETRRNINAGVTITPHMLIAPDAVSRGDRVIISAGNSAFAIETRGEAVTGGKIGDQITVKNETSGRQVRGRITAPGRVDINR